MAVGPAPKQRTYASPRNDWQLNRKARLIQLIQIGALAEDISTPGPVLNAILEEDGTTIMTEEDGSTAITDE